MINLSKEVEKCILDAVKVLIETKNSSDKLWTKAIFNNLTEYAYINDKYVWSHKNDIDNTINEWLYDFVIYEGSPNDISDILVTLESEWNRSFDEIKYDFYKLIQSRSKLRVMIFQAKDVDEITNKLINIVNSSIIAESGDEYLFACWNDDVGFTMRSYIKI